MIRAMRKVLNLVDWVAENTDLTAEDNHNLQADLFQIAADITEKDAEIDRLKEVEKDSTDLHTIVKQQAFQLRQLKGILEEMFKVCPCMCNTALDYDCPKCEARRMLKAMEEQSQKMGSFCGTEKG